MVLMERQVKDALETIRDHHESLGGRLDHRNGYPMRMERDVILMWGKYRGWSISAIARALWVSRPTVYKGMRILADDPDLVFRCSVFHQGFRKAGLFYRCEFCGDEMRITRPKKASEHRIKEHVLNHLFTPEAIARNWSARQ